MHIATGYAAIGARGKPGFFLPVRVLSRLFRRLFLDGIAALQAAGRLAFLGDLAPLTDRPAFDAALAPLRRSECRVGGDVAIPTPLFPGNGSHPAAPPFPRAGPGEPSSPRSAVL